MGAKAMKFVLCSDCFLNSGLRSEAARFGIRTSSKCPACGSTQGRKLGRKQLEKLTVRFFVTGTVPHGVGGYASILRYDPDSDLDEVEFDHKTSRDWRLIKSHIGGRLFFYGPPLWRIGITEHYKEPNDVSDEVLDEIITKLSVRTLVKGTTTFRIRKNVDSKSVLEETQYLNPPPHIKHAYGRFDDANLEILYTSPSLPVCLHECRVAITDDLFVATFEAAQDIRLADLTANYDQKPQNPFEDLRYFFNGIFLAREETVYGIARRIASKIKGKLGVDGFITDSFFTTISQEPVSQNYCFFTSALGRNHLFCTH